VLTNEGTNSLYSSFDRPTGLLPRFSHAVFTPFISARVPMKGLILKSEYPASISFGYCHLIKNFVNNSSSSIS
jgi:hypothetical protein